jgi:hypothetical protein
MPHSNYEVADWAKEGHDATIRDYLAEHGLADINRRPDRGSTTEGLARVLRDGAAISDARSGAKSAFTYDAARSAAINAALDRGAKIRQQIEDVKSGKVAPATDGKTMAKRNALLSDVFDEENALICTTKKVSAINDL